MKTKGRKLSQRAFVSDVGRALRKAAQDARMIARQWGTPIYIIKDGKIAAKKP